MFKRGEFYKGQRVVYTGGYAPFPEKEFVGHTGTVIDPVTSVKTVMVEWDNIVGKVRPPRGCYRENVGPLLSEEVAGFRVGDRVRVNNRCSIPEWRGKVGTVTNVLPSGNVEGTLDDPPQNWERLALEPRKWDRVESNVVEDLRAAVVAARAEGYDVEVKVSKTTSVYFEL